MAITGFKTKVCKWIIISIAPFKENTLGRHKERNRIQDTKGMEYRAVGIAVLFLF